MLRTTVTGLIVVGSLLGARAAMAETWALPAGLTAPAIIPVTGPSVGPSLADPVKPELIPVMVPADTKNGEITSRTGTRRVASAGHPLPKNVHKSPRSHVKKTPPTAKHVSKAAGASNAKHVAQTKHKPPTHHAMVGKPTPAGKNQPVTPSGKGGTAAPPVLPRV